MNTYSIDDKQFKQLKTYKDFIKNNPSVGYLKIRAFAASQAIPISNLKITVSKNIDNFNVIFYEGYTNESGVIEKINLPTPKLDSSNQDAPKTITYEITATYIPNNTVNKYTVNMYENIYVVQTIGIVPDLNVMAGGN